MLSWWGMIQINHHLIMGGHLRLSDPFKLLLCCFPPAHKKMANYAIQVKERKKELGPRYDRIVFTNTGLL